MPPPRPSVLDRLMEEPPPEADGVEALRQAVRRDLEALLNARRRRRLLPPGLAELTASPLGYGIPDATAGSYAQEDAREALARDVAETIRRFEPRLEGVSVLLEPADALERTLRLRISATLRAGPLPEPVSFETMLEAVSHAVEVREG